MKKDIIVTWKKGNVVENWGKMVGLYAEDLPEAYAIVKDQVSNMDLIESVKLGKSAT